MKTWTHIDKSRWGEGPWHKEPDKAYWVDPKTGLDCLIVRTALGHLCGYVGVPPKHPFHGKHYDKCDVDVHGGLTYADECQKDDKEHGICHVSEPGREDNIWWLGFDCAHLGDISPGGRSALRDLGNMAGAIVGMDKASSSWLEDRERGETYKTFKWVKQEVTNLAKQVKDAE